MDLYAQNVMDHYKNPRNYGGLSGPDIVHKEANYSCGDTLEVSLKIKDGILTDIGFTGGGCAISMAAMSIIGEYIKGKTIDEIMDMTEEDIHEHIGVPIGERRRKCAILNLLTIKNALLEYLHKDKMTWLDVIEE